MEFFIIFCKVWNYQKHLKRSNNLYDLSHVTWKDFCENAFRGFGFYHYNIVRWYRARDKLQLKGQQMLLEFGNLQYITLLLLVGKAKLQLTNAWW